MNSVSQAKVARIGLIILHADEKNLKIMFKSSKNPEKWKVFEDGFKTKQALSKKFASMLHEHQNYVED